MNISISVLNNAKTLRAVERKIQKTIRTIALDLYIGVKVKTPVDTGKAKRAWKLKKTSQGYSVSNNKPYIERLDEGYSKQAPNGMTKPILRQIQRRKY